MKFYKNIFTIIIFSLILLSACTSEGEKVMNEGVEEIASLKGEIIITSEQFNSAGMKLGEISEQSFSEIIQTTGMMDVPPEYKAAVSVYYGGTIKTLHLLAGQNVKMGETLFTIENPEYIQLQQDYLNAKNRLNYLKSEYERETKLLKENISSQKKFLKAESDYHTVLLDYEALEKKLQLLNIDSKKLTSNTIATYTEIKAPIGGIVTEVNIIKGKYLSPNEVAVSIVNTKHMHIELSVFEKDINKIRKGETIHFTLPDNRNDVFEGEVFLVGQSVHSSDRTINIHGHLKDETMEKHFIPGMYIEAKILVDEVNQMSLPTNAIVDVEDAYYVLVKKSSNNGKQIFIKREVKVGRTNSGFTEILNATEFKGHQIVTEGAFNLIQ